jgi:DNA-binding protein HU-beta
MAMSHQRRIPLFSQQRIDFSGGFFKNAAHLLCKASRCLTSGILHQLRIMNKAELIESVLKNLGKDASKKSAAAAVDAVLDAIAGGVRKDKVVQLIGFGTFKVTNRAARKGRNPKTGEPIKIKASKGVRFSASSALKARL